MFVEISFLAVIFINIRHFDKNTSVIGFNVLWKKCNAFSSLKLLHQPKIMFLLMELSVYIYIYMSEVGKCK